MTTLTSPVSARTVPEARLPAEPHDSGATGWERACLVDDLEPSWGEALLLRMRQKGDRPTSASPLLKQVYDLGTGECFTDAALRLPTFRTRVVGGFIEVEAPA